ncbi:MAG TPA: hypothetical protein PKX00_13325 [Opitutaceae bacterium]|jgi:hypothetical protein|nr:hypothetical protein [Opitutaceae bacterium]HRE06588.1 hypothetical protein [Opitutaceae bacterium]
MNPLRVLALLAFLLPGVGRGDELAALAQEDQAVRAGRDDPRSDEERRRRVLELFAAGKVESPQNKFHAALVLQHTGMRYCDGELVSLSAENYLLAHYLFKEAWAGGVKEAGYLVAASIDRYLSVTQGMQKYGTNRVFDQDSGKEFLVPIDRSVTDAERKKHGVPSLKELLERWPEKQKKKSPGAEG